MFSKLVFTSHFAVSTLAATTTLTNVYLGLPPDGNSFAGSVVGVGNSLTTIAMACTAGGEPGDGCGKNALTETVTFNSSFLAFSSIDITTLPVSIGGSTITETIQATCSIRGTTSAICTSIVFQGEPIPETIAFTTAGPSLIVPPVTITAGAEKLPAATSSSAKVTSLATVTSSAKTSSSSGAAPTVGISGILVGGAALAVGVLI